MDVKLNSDGQAWNEQSLPQGNEKQSVEKLEPDAEKLQGLSAIVTEGYNIDRNSLTYMQKGWDECKKLVSMLPDTKGGRFENASNVNIPIILNAANVFNARAYAAFFKANDIVKCEVIGDDTGLFEVQLGMDGKPATNPQDGKPIITRVVAEAGAKQKRADRISQHMSWQLTYQMPHWIEDQDKLLTLAPIYGCLFKKIYYNSYTKQNCSELIMPQYLTVHNETRELDTAPRITHSFGLYPYEIQERIGAEYFDAFDYSSDDSGEQHEFLEQHLRYDLDDDGYDEPLIVTVHSESGTVVRVEKRYIDADVTKNKKGEIIKIEPENFFVKFGFMPNPTGGFYDIGFGYLLFQLNKAINTTTNQLIDAGTLGNSPFFLLERGRMKGGEVKVRPGFGLFVKNDSRPLRDSIYQMTFNGPDSVLFQLLGFLFEYARSLGGMREVLEGGMRSDQTTGSTEMLIQEGMNEYKAIYKRIWRAMSHEYKRLFDLNHRYLDDKEYFKVLDNQEMLGKVDINRTDYNSDDFDVRPVADAEYLTSAQEKAQARTILELAGADMVDKKVATRIALKVENIPQQQIDELLNFEPSQLELQIQKEKQDLERAAVAAQDKEAQANILKEQNAKRKLDIEEAKAIFEVDQTRAETFKTIAETDKIVEEADMNALEVITNRMSGENEQRVAEIEKGSQPAAE